MLGAYEKQHLTPKDDRFKNLVAFFANANKINIALFRGTKRPRVRLTNIVADRFPFFKENDTLAAVGFGDSDICTTVTSTSDTKGTRSRRFSVAHRTGKLNGA